jgi:hypothetical protein
MRYYRLVRTGKPDFKEKLALLFTVTDKLPASLRWTELTVYRTPQPRSLAPTPALYAHVEYHTLCGDEQSHADLWEAHSPEGLLDYLKVYDASEWMHPRPVETIDQIKRNQAYNQEHRSLLLRGWGRIVAEATEKLMPKAKRGVGRPTKVSLGGAPRSVSLSTRVTQEVAAQFDECRGELPRAAFLEHILAQYLDQRDAKEHAGAP